MNGKVKVNIFRKMFTFEDMIKFDKDSQIKPQPAGHRGPKIEKSGGSSGKGKVSKEPNSKNSEVPKRNSLGLPKSEKQGARKGEKSSLFQGVPTTSKGVRKGLRVLSPSVDVSPTDSVGVSPCGRAEVSTENVRRQNKPIFVTPVNRDLKCQNF